MICRQASCYEISKIHHSLSFFLWQPRSLHHKKYRQVIASIYDSHTMSLLGGHDVKEGLSSNGSASKSSLILEPGDQPVCQISVARTRGWLLLLLLHVLNSNNPPATFTTKWGTTSNDSPFAARLGEEWEVFLSSYCCHNSQTLRDYTGANGTVDAAETQGFHNQHKSGWAPVCQMAPGF